MKTHMRMSSAAASMIRARNAQRSDCSRFTHLLQSDSFDKLKTGEQQSLLHPYLLEGLQANNYQYLTTLQKEAIEQGIMDGQHMLLRGANGTGKTLAYLLPVLNRLYGYQAEMCQETSHITKSISKDNEGEMFQNANLLLQVAKKHKTQQLGPMRGAIIVSRSKELVNQIYTQIRLLDSVNTVRVNRMASALQMNSSIVEFITPEKTQSNKEEDEKAARDKMFNISLTNIQNNASWDLSDIIVSTPTTLSHTIGKRAEYAPYNINPEVVIFDECDQLYEDPEGKLKRPLHNILSTFFTRNPTKASRDFIECNRRR